MPSAYSYEYDYGYTSRTYTSAYESHQDLATCSSEPGAAAAAAARNVPMAHVAGKFTAGELPDPIFFNLTVDDAHSPIWARAGYEYQGDSMELDVIIPSGSIPTVLLAAHRMDSPPPSAPPPSAPSQPPSPPPCAYIFLDDAEQGRDFCVQPCDDSLGTVYEEVHVWLESCTSTPTVHAHTTLDTSLIHLSPPSLSIRKAQGDNFATFDLSCTANATSRLLLDGAQSCSVHSGSYAIQGTSGQRVAILFEQAPPRPPPPPPPPPPKPPATPPTSPPPPPLLNCTVDHLAYHGNGPLNYSLETADGNLYAEVSSSFDFVELDHAVACLASNPSSDSNVLGYAADPLRWACADVATYETMGRAESGGELFGQVCPGTNGEVFGDRVVDAHDVRVMLMAHFGIWPVRTARLAAEEDPISLLCRHRRLPLMLLLISSPQTAHICFACVLAVQHY